MRRTTQKDVSLPCKTDPPMNIYFDGFKTFFKIGLFTLGGGYAMIPLIQEEVVNRHHWLDEKDFIDLLAVSQTIPGVFAVNMSINIGYRLRKLPGALVMALGTILPSFLIILAIAMFFHSFRDNPNVEAVFKGIRPAVVALIALPVFRLAKSARITLTNIWIPVFAALAIWLLGVSPVYIILAVGVGGYLYGVFMNPHNSERINRDNDL